MSENKFDEEDDELETSVIQTQGLVHSLAFHQFAIQDRDSGRWCSWKVFNDYGRCACTSQACKLAHWTI